MTEEIEHALGSHNSELSQSESHITPLSPVLGSGESVRKFLKNRKRHKKNLSKAVQKPEDVSESNNESCRNVVEQEEEGFVKQGRFEGSLPIPSPRNESIFDRIQKLEALELRKSNTIKAISSSVNVSLSESIITNSKASFKENSSANKPSPGELSSQTKTEQNFNISKIRSSRKLFEDSNQGNYIYLHKTVEDPINKPKNVFEDAASVALANEEIQTKACNNLFFSENIHEVSSEKESPVIQFTSEGSKAVKNIFEGESFDDLPLGRNVGFKLASTGLGQVKNETSDPNLKSMNNKICNNPSVNQSTGFKPVWPKPMNIFEGEQFDDLPVNHADGFKSASLALGNGKIQIKAGKNVFEGENFDDLASGENAGFKPASVSLAAHLPGLEYSSFKGKVSNNSSVGWTSRFKPTQKTSHSFQPNRRTMFEGENFDDLNLAGQGLDQTITNQDAKTTGLQNKIVTQRGCRKVLKNVFEGENFDDLPSGENTGFKSASISLGHTMEANNATITVPSLKYSSHMFQAKKSISSSEGCRSEFKPAPKTRQSFQLKRRNIFEGENFDDLNLAGLGFGQINTSQGAKTTGCFITETGCSKRLKNVFEGENFDENTAASTANLLSSKPSKSAFQREILNNLDTSVYKPVNNSLQPKWRTIFEGENLDDLTVGPRFAGFMSSKPNALHNKCLGGFQRPYMGQNSDFQGFSREEQQASLNISRGKRQIFKILSDGLRNHELALFRLNNINRLSENIQKDIEKCFNYEGNNRKSKFSELDSDHNSCQNIALPLSLSKKSKKRLGCPFSPTIGVSHTGLKRAKLLFEDLEPKPIGTSTPVKFSAKPLPCDLTPIPSVKKQIRQDVKTCNRFSLNKPSRGDVTVWLDNLNNERRILQERLRIIDEKQTILANQQANLGCAKRIIPGVLYKSKNSSCKVSLRKYVDYVSPGQSSRSDDVFLNQINPQNAHLMHFYVCDKRESHVKTEDGAVIVSNIDFKIGLAEIEHSFKLLEGVDSNLMPPGWIHNHYKWIIWKLASYERTFADKFEGCLSLENVVQQLKYRYDIEIDNTRRPILRKIFEKDDCSQRRMTLCVSKIVKVNNSYELELTDGWYSIRTVIDSPLSDQVLKAKIRLGVKLVVYGAELVNCEGCHPLEAADSTYLKINYNSTRRALWWCKLGCQKNSGPFLTPMSSINVEGGKIGCVRCFILRAYPVKFLEKCGDKKVWRNRKAEERREQDFYNEKFKRGNIGFKDIQSINDPETLYELMQQSHDPEELQEMLSSSQRTVLYNYSVNKSGQAGHRAHVRSVAPALKIKIIDCLPDSDIVYDFHVWRPGEGHLQELKEGEIVTIFNVSCSSKWGLSANQTTQFRREAKPEDDRFQKFRRRVTEISELKSFSKRRHLLNEFDTVGMVVHKFVGDNQQVWMADGTQNLLMIRINDSPKKILALDTISEGQLVSVCNLMLKHAYDTHSFAVADYSVIFARYSQYKHLQDGLEKLEGDFKDLDKDRLLRTCQSRISQIEAQWEPRSAVLDLDEMDCSQITTTDMALLECVEKLI